VFARVFMPEGSPNPNNVVYYILKYEGRVAEEKIPKLAKVSKASTRILPHWKGNTAKSFKLPPSFNARRFAVTRMSPFDEFVKESARIRQRVFLPPEDLNTKPWLNHRTVEFPADQWIHLPQGDNVTGFIRYTLYYRRNGDN